jgi:uncharacterized protein involved in outer membrane biogenesis
MAKIIVKILLVLILVFILIAASFSAYVLFNARIIVVSVLEKNLGIKAEMTSLRVSLPATIIIDDLSVQEGLRIKKVVITPSFIGLLSGDFVLSQLILDEPQCKIARNADDSYDFGVVFYKKSGDTAVVQQREETKSEKKSKKPFRFYINKLKVNNGQVEFTDKGIKDQPPFVFKLVDFYADIFRPSLLSPARMQFQVKGRIVNETGQLIGLLETAGWADILGLDMDAKALLSDVRLVYLRPYYKKAFKKDLKSGDAMLTADLKSKANDLKADCHVALSNVSFKEVPQEPVAGEEAGTTDLTALAFSSIFNAEGGAFLDFSIETKMDHPKFEHLKIKGNFLQSRVQNILSKPPQEAIQDFKDISKEFQAIGKEFKKMFKSK